MKNLLLSGTTLIVDRYAYSGVSYSVAKVTNKNNISLPPLNN